MAQPMHTAEKRKVLAGSHPRVQAVVFCEKADTAMDIVGFIDDVKSGNRRPAPRGS
jgi:hypothetical protein